MDYIVLMDVSGDLDLSIDAVNEVKYLPMEYTLGEEVHEINRQITRAELHAFYESLRNKIPTKTTQITPFRYEELVTPWFKKGISVLCLTLSGGLSSTYQSAVTAKASLEEKFPGLLFCPVDSKAASGGIGLLAERALRNLKGGMSILDNVKDLEASIAKIQHRFLVQDLLYLKRGGRIDAATAVLGTALNIKPIIIIDKEGKLVTVAKKRGNRQAAQEILKFFEENYDPHSGDPVYVVDADTDETAEYLLTEAKKLFPDAVFRRTGLSPIIGAHTGPDMAALCFIGK